MTDDRRIEIERRFDGEPDAFGSSRPLDDFADDPEARRHLDRLALLRQLARSHDPASSVARKPFALPDRRPRPTSWRLAVAATAAALALVVGWKNFRKGDVPRISIVEKSTKSITRPVESIAGRPPLEVELYGWANTPSRTPRQAARLVLGPGSASRKRSPANEILALELANTTPQPRSGVQQFAVSKGAKPPPPATRPGPRTKATLPEA